ncbi:MAG: AAA family ATPase [Acidobacteria bacterium]|jgi:predicted kinase|nr:AAA family ATPase [Acidobacteriota bacterium]
MRKWMRERLQRRKKSTETQPAESQPAPLQPVYFEPASPSLETDSSGEFPAAVEAPEAEPPEESAEPSESAGEAASSGEGSPTRRRRRRRGGRGRGGSSAAAKVEAPAEPAEAPEAPAAKVDTPARAPKGIVVLSIGLPGSGKSAWFKRHNITPLSSDMLRALLFDDETEQRFQDLIFSNLRSMLKARLIARRPVNYVDATNLTPHDRHSWIKLAKDFGYEVQAVFFDVPLEVCLERNRKRQRQVAEEVMHRFAGKLKPPAFEEGFSKITVVRVKQKAAD